MSKTVKDLPGWKPIDHIRKGIIGNYQTYVSPDGKKVAHIHLDDEEVVIIIERKTGDVIYIHPITLEGLKKVGMSVEEFKEIMKREYLGRNVK